MFSFADRKADSNDQSTTETLIVAVVGLGYVGLPLAIAIAQKYDVIGFDTDDNRVQELLAGVDRTEEIASTRLKDAKRFTPTSKASSLSSADLIIITVPTPVDENNVPDLNPLRSASATVGAQLKHGAIVVYESTVFPGATEDICIPILEHTSGKRLHDDFHVGYSPERVNPGDKIRTVIDIPKVTSASSAEALERVDQFYRSIVLAGTHRAPSIKVAEAAKVIENAQRTKQNLSCGWNQYWGCT
jgi:UDP-N-acetyl-D-galactosamine dehydrogenase